VAQETSARRMFRQTFVESLLHRRAFRGNDFIGFFMAIQFADAPESRMMQSTNFQ
jgi:hypothetical protein